MTKIIDYLQSKGFTERRSGFTEDKKRIWVKKLDDRLEVWIWLWEIVTGYKFKAVFYRDDVCIRIDENTKAIKTEEETLGIIQEICDEQSI
jgi:hypothetical protein